MSITQRQEKLLNTLVKDYIEEVNPVSSEYLKDKYNLGVCSATVRGEMQKLTKKGYLKQPHTSSGRVPTNKAYRFFVDSFLEKGSEEYDCPQFEELKKMEDDIFRFAELTTRILASRSCGLVISCLLKEGLLWEDGWEEIFRTPEFEDKSFRNIFIKEAKSLEKSINELCELPDSINIYIGREKSVLGSQDLSLMVAKSRFSDKGEGMLAVLGPNRMAYDKNIRVINSLIKIMEE